jgi:hypothetical protein
MIVIIKRHLHFSELTTWLPKEASPPTGCISHSAAARAGLHVQCCFRKKKDHSVPSYHSQNGRNTNGDPFDSLSGLLINKPSPTVSPNLQKF